MFEDREPSIFPHPVSAWWVPIVLVIGWGPLFVADLIYPGAGMGFGMGWGMAVAFPCTILAAISVPIQALRLLMYFLNRPRPIPK